MSEIKSNVSSENTETGAIMSNKKQWLFIVLFVVIAGVSVLSIITQMEDFSLSQFVGYIKNANISWLIVAVLSMLGFIFFEAFALMAICRAMGYKSKLRQAYVYSASDIYFSALTPSATGGQPASAYFMVKDGMNGMLVTAILVANLCMYTLAIIVIGTFCFILRFDYFLKFSFTSRALILVGFAVQIVLLIFFYMVLKREKMLHRMCNAVLRFLCKIKIFKKYDEKQTKLDAYMAKYRQHSKIITGHSKALIWCFVFNLIQRASQIAVSMFVYIATTGKDLAEAAEIFFWQGYSVLGSNLIPIPGGMGISDHLMLEGFENVMEKEAAANFELLSRSFSFYGCVIICGITFFIQYSIVKKRERRK